MNLYLRILSYVKPYWYFMAGAMVCMACFALTSSATVWVALPFLQTLFGQETVQTDGTAPGGPAGPAEQSGQAGQAGQSGQSGQIDAARDAANRLEQRTGMTGLRETLKERTNDLITRPTRQATLERLCLIILFILLLKNISSYLQAYLMAYAENGVIKDLRNHLYIHLHRLSLSYFHRERTGELISRVSYDVMKINGTVSAAFGTLIKEPMLVAVYLAILVILSWQLTLVSLVLLPFSVLVITTVGRRLRRSSTASQEAMADLTSTLQETVAGARVVKAFNMESFEIDKFKRQTRHYFQTLLRLTHMHNLASPITEILGSFVGLAILWYGGRQVLEGGLLAPEDFLTFFLALFSMMKPVKELGQVHNRIQEGIAAADRVFTVLDTAPEITDAPDADRLPGLRREIRFDRVTFRYDRASEPALEEIDLVVRCGETVALVGPSGGGKSTLVDLVARFYDPTGGRIEIDGRDLRSVTVASLREKMGIVTQDVILFNDTVRNNIAYGVRETPLDQIRSAAAAANADGFIEELPDGYETGLGERGVRLSGGQRQRIAIARAILKDPQILIFDEATSSLDTESELLVQEAIDRLMKGRTALVIAHRLSTVQQADRVVVVDRGRIVQHGDHGSLVREDGLYRKLYNMQFRDQEPVVE